MRNIRFSRRSSDRRIATLGGSITIIHLLLLVIVTGACQFLAGGDRIIHVDESNRQWLTFLDRADAFVMSPLAILLHPLCPPSAPQVASLIYFLALVVANSMIVGYGLAGIVRLCTGSTFGLRLLLLMTTLFCAVLSWLRVMSIGPAVVYVGLALTSVLLAGFTLVGATLRSRPRA